VRLKRRQPQEKWTPIEVMTDVELAFYGDADQRYVRSAAVVRYAYERLPNETLKAWKADAESEHPGRGMPSHGVFKFDFGEDDRFALYMEHDTSAVIREIEVAFDLDEASTAARGWVGESHTKCHFMNIPGVYQAALIEAVTGVARFWNEIEMSWWFPGDGPYVPFKKYPPPLNEPDGFVLMPREVGHASHRAFLMSPTQESELRSKSFLSRHTR